MQSVCVCVFFLKLLSYPCHQESQCCRQGESRQQDWPLTSRVNLSLYREGFWPGDHGMHSCALSILIVVMVIREGHSKRHNFKFDLRNCQHS